MLRSVIRYWLWSFFIAALFTGACTAKYVVDGTYKVEGETDGEAIQDISEKITEEIFEDCEKDSQAQPDVRCPDEGRDPPVNELLPADRGIQN